MTYGFDVAVDQLDLDRFTGKAAEPGKPAAKDGGAPSAGTPPSGAPAPEKPIDLSALKDLNANGKLAITRVELHPKIVYSGAKQPAAADLEWLHDKAHKECFIANSVKTDVTVEMRS